MKNKIILTFALMAFSAIASAQQAPDIAGSFTGLCVNVKAAVPIVAFTMLLIGGIIYAAGQIMGAETRARANVWATALLIGGVFGLIIAASAPYLLNFFASMFASDMTNFSC
jgi:hypothetical protein